MMFDTDKIRKEMNMWRKGFCAIPQDYLAMHEYCARESLPELEANLDGRVIFVETVSDGWMDGMKVLRAVVETSRHEFVDCRWADSNGGGWWKQANGRTQIFQPDNAPGHM
jgi:hypothetical protein